MEKEEILDMAYESLEEMKRESIEEVRTIEAKLKQAKNKYKMLTRAIDKFEKTAPRMLEDIIEEGDIDINDSDEVVEEIVTGFLGG